MSHAIVNSYIGKPYEYGARGPQAFDCWGLVLHLRAALGLVVPVDFASREAARLAHRSGAWGVEAAGGPVPCEPCAGCIVYAPGLAHAGVFWCGMVVHSMHRAGVVAWPMARWLAHFDESEFYEWPRASSSC